MIIYRIISNLYSIRYKKHAIVTLPSDFGLSYENWIAVVCGDTFGALVVCCFCVLQRQKCLRFVFGVCDCSK